MRRLLRLDLLFALSLLFVMTSCSKDKIEPLVVEKSTDVKLNIPNSFGAEVVSRTTTAPSAEELKIHDGHFFIFDASGVYVAHQSFGEANVTSNGGLTPILSLPIANKIEIGHQVLIIINQYLEGTIVSPSLSETYGLFTLVDNPLIDDATDVVRIPMHGHIAAWALGNTIDITRAMAKVQVKLAADLDVVDGVYPGTSGGASNFDDISRVTYKIYQYASKGMIEPLASPQLNPITSGLVEPLELIVDEHITNRVTKIGVDADNYLGASYLYEFNYATKTIGATLGDLTNVKPSPDRLAVIVRAKDRFYRLDMCNKASTTLGAEYIDIARNKHYTILITKVDGNGYRSATEALLFPPSNVEYLVEATDGGYTAGNSQYALTVDSKHDNYVSSTEAIIKIDAMLVLGKNSDGSLVDIPTVPEDYSQYLSVTQSEATGAVLIVEAGVGVIKKDVLSPLTWRVTSTGGAYGKATIKLKIEFGSLSVEREVMVVILDDEQVASSYGIYSYNIPLWGGTSASGGNWTPDAAQVENLQAVSVTFNDDFKRLNITDNVNPTGWTGGTATDYDSTPTFTARSVKGDVVTYTDKGIIKTRLNVTQAAAVYVGRTGDIITSLNFDATMGDIISSSANERKKRVISNSGTAITELKNVESRYHNYLSGTSADVTLDAEVLKVRNTPVLTHVSTTALDGEATSRWVVTVRPVILDVGSNSIVWNVTTIDDVPGKAKFMFKVELGLNSFEKEVVVEVLGSVKGESSYGLFRHPIDLAGGISAISNSWTADVTNVENSQLSAVTFSDDFTKINISDNIGIMGWIKAGSNGVDFASTYDSRPIFAQRRVLGDVVTISNAGEVRTRLNIIQLQPFYIGRLGAEIINQNLDAAMGDVISTSSALTYKRLITGSHNEVNLDGTTTIAWWGNSNGLVYASSPISPKPAGMNGLAITEHVRSDDTGSDRIWAAGLLYCYRRNGSAVDEYTKVTTWYMPAINQIEGLFVKKQEISNIPFEFHYWSSTEKDSELSWYLNMKNGTRNPGKKYFGEYKIRCVREL